MASSPIESTDEVPSFADETGWLSDGVISVKEQERVKKKRKQSMKECKGLASQMRTVFNNKNLISHKMEYVKIGIRFLIYKHVLLHPDPNHEENENPKQMDAISSTSLGSAILLKEIMDRYVEDGIWPSGPLNLVCLAIGLCIRKEYLEMQDELTYNGYTCYSSAVLPNNLSGLRKSDREEEEEEEQARMKVSTKSCSCGENHWLSSEKLVWQYGRKGRKDKVPICECFYGSAQDGKLGWLEALSFVHPKDLVAWFCSPEQVATDALDGSSTLQMEVLAIRKACSAATRESLISLVRGVEDDLQDLKETVLTIQAVLLDAEKQSHNNHVKNWLQRLSTVVLKADDLMDEVNTQALRCQLIMSHNPMANQSKKSIPRHGGELKELMRLNNLRGGLEVTNLSCEKDVAAEYDEAKLKDKQYL
ncbi:hypothetical protein G4B88_001228 [Cannabis sativa]|uniref:Disease resistance N-terminal domain-containing protein n=1 Tax=Cannabis sativa TaxID=3483 RepID=A0A7J6ED52_CANSA|nr:hypothetical protein G4B88_001228 [Cannabis sativa]